MTVCNFPLIWMFSHVYIYIICFLYSVKNLKRGFRNCNLKFLDNCSKTFSIYLKKEMIKHKQHLQSPHFIKKIQRTIVATVLISQGLSVVF